MNYKILPKISIFLFSFTLSLLIIPNTVLAQVASDEKNLAGLIKLVTNNILNPVIGLLVGIAVLLFIWGVLKYVNKGGDEKEREKAIQLIVWGIISIFVMLSVWGLVGILTGTFFPGGSPTPPIPKLPTS